MGYATSFNGMSNSLQWDMQLPSMGCQTPFNRICNSLQWDMQLPSMGYQTPFNGISNSLQWDIKLPSMGYQTPFNGISNSKEIGPRMVRHRRKIKTIDAQTVVRFPYRLATWYWYIVNKHCCFFFSYAHTTWTICTRRLVDLLATR